MAIFSIPIGEEAFSSQLTDLDGTGYILKFSYNQRASCYFMGIYTEAEEPIVTGVKVTCEYPLFIRYADPRLPPGVLIARSADRDQSPPTLGELGDGKRVELLYFTTDSL
jgi:hypothetical protein